MNTRKQQMVYRNVLKNMEIFHSLRKEEIDFLLENIRIKEQVVGTILYHENCHFDGVCLLVKGVVKQYKTGNKGKELIIRFAKAGEIIGFRSYVSGELTCSTTQVMEDASVGYINGSCLLRLMKWNTNFSLFFIKQACRELEATQTFILNVAQKKVRERVAEVLIHLKDTFEIDDDDKLKVPLSRKELANIVGIAPESVILMLSDFRNEKLIEVNGKHIRLLNIPKLIRIGSVAI